MDYQTMTDQVCKVLNEISSLVLKLDSAHITQAASAIIAAVKKGHKILFCGNGGSAADAQHMVAELVGRFLYERRPIAALALTTNTSVLTAIANDYNFDTVFSRQVEALGSEGDVLVAISTSGRSTNVINAIEAARRKGITVIGLTGEDGGLMKKLCDVCIRIPTNSTPRIQEMHTVVGHILCQLVEEAIM